MKYLYELMFYKASSKKCNFSLCSSLVCWPIACPRLLLISLHVAQHLVSSLLPSCGQQYKSLHWHIRMAHHITTFLNFRAGIKAGQSELCLVSAINMLSLHRFRFMITFISHSSFNKKFFKRAVRPFTFSDFQRIVLIKVKIVKIAQAKWASYASCLL